MNKWKVIAGILLIFILGVFSGAIGTSTFFKHRIKRFMDPQGPPPPIRLLQRQLGEFDLSSEQHARIDALFEEMHREFVRRMKKGQKEIKQLFDEYISQIKGVLASEQGEKLDRIVERIENRMQAMQSPPPPMGHGGPPPGDGFKGPAPKGMFIQRLQKELSLSDEQVQQIRPILEEEREKQKELFSKTVNGEGDRDDFRNRMDAIRRETDARMVSILTPEQMERFRALRQPPGFPGRPSPMGKE